MPTNTTYNHDLCLLQDHIFFLKDYVMALQKRLLLARDNYALKNAFEKNEVEVLTYETLTKISASQRQINSLQTEFTHRLFAFKQDLEDMHANYDTLLAIAKKKQSESIAIKHFLYETNWKTINESVVEKIIFYKNLKNVLANEKI